MKANLPFQWLTALVWAGAAASTVYWFLQFSGGQDAPPSRPIVAIASEQAGVRPAKLIQFFGGGTASAAAPAPVTKGPRSGRFVLLGVVTAGAGGAALIAVDGRPARPFMVGSLLDDGTYLSAVGKRFALLSEHRNGPPVERIDMPGSVMR